MQQVVGSLTVVFGGKKTNNVRIEFSKGVSVRQRRRVLRYLKCSGKKVLCNIRRNGDVILAEHIETASKTQVDDLAHTCMERALKIRQIHRLPVEPAVTPEPPLSATIVRHHGNGDRPYRNNPPRRRQVKFSTSTA